MAEPHPQLSGWALVLGASSGFGAATARYLATCGMNIVGVHFDRRNTQHLADAVKQDIEAQGRQAHFFNGDVLYKRFTPAGPDHAQIAASAGMADYVDLLCDHHNGPETGATARGAFVHDLMRDQEVALLQPVLDAVKDRNAVRLIGTSDAARRAPTVALALNRNAEAIAADLVDHGIMAGGGDFYAVRPLQAMGVDLEQGVLRVSFTHYTSQQEIDQLLNALDAVL